MSEVGVDRNRSGILFASKNEFQSVCRWLKSREEKEEEEKEKEDKHEDRFSNFSRVRSFVFREVLMKYAALSRRKFSCSTESLLTIRVNLVGLIATSTVAAASAVVWCATGTSFASTEANDEVIAS
ncbi:hypothetical protein KQX54_020119 [Cotesia glomerata]|uniref:Transmembrane protein n=1 Tax=Cotesia glomerata TaxID=32391 RepID=A0AAV7I4J1_COTGL|nr:hypothetical protein KQX54_020119 [Cotesia glomerata]